MTVHERELDDDGARRRLRRCPASPNCVSSVDARPSRKMPPLRFEAPLEAARSAIRAVIESAGGVVVEEEELYLRAEFTSRLLRFVDDVELALDPGRGRIDFRSASRVGYSDLGVNRRRMEQISKRLAERPGFDIEP